MPIQSAKVSGPGVSPCQPSSPVRGGKGKNPANFEATTSKSGQRSPAQTGSASEQQTTSVGKFNLAVLREGAQGKQVELLQRSLNALGYKGCKADGKFGPKTTDTTRAFQAACGLKRDGVVGNRETWPALNKALTTRHEGLTRLGEAMGHTRLGREPLATSRPNGEARSSAEPASNARAISEPMVAERKQLGTLLADFSDRTMVRGRDEVPLPTITGRSTGEMVYVNRGGDSLTDVSRMFNVPMTALLASNPDITKPYLILPGQQIVIPNLIRDEQFQRPPRQLHPADPNGHLASSNMNPDFVDRINAMIQQLRSEGFDVRVIAGFRTFSQQQERFEQGRIQTGAIVTEREAGHSWHNYGLAVDIALNDDDGDVGMPEASSPFWQRLGDVALAHGTTWGGLFGDPSHVEYHPDFGTHEAGSFIEDFESYGLEAVWNRIALAIPPEV